MKKIFLPVSLLILLLTLILPFRCIAQGPPITFGRTDPPINLLNGGNTQWVFCSNSDTNKGISTMTYDAGAAGGGDIPDPGDSGTGGTSGATCKIISVTVSTGAFATNDATGTIQIGASAGRFHDNETVTFDDGETVVVNHPNSAAGVDLVQNGELSVDTDPPPGWTVGASATLTTEAGGKVGNCLMVTCDGSDNPYAYQYFTVTAGKQYYFNCYIKAGTEATYAIFIRNKTAASTIYGISTEETAGDWSTSISRYVTAPSGCTQIEIRLYQYATAGAATTMYFDEISCYEVTPCCTGADGLAFDGWKKDNTLDIYRQHNDGGTYTKDGSFYSLKYVPSAQNDEFWWPISAIYNKSEFYQQFAGRTVTFACWALSSTADDFRIGINDGATNTYSSYHTGGGSWEWLEITTTIQANPTQFFVKAGHFNASPDIAYFSQPILVFGSSIGAGNYVPEANKVVYFENDIASQTFNTTGFSDVAITELNLESDSLACIGKGVKAVRVFTKCNDSGSAGTDCYFHAGYDISVAATEFMNSPYGRANDTYERKVGWIPCNQSGNYEYQIDASGGSTFDMIFKYIGAEWR